MTAKGSGKPPMVAVRRTGSARQAPAGKTPAKAPAPKRKAPRPPRRGGIIGFFSGILRFIWRMVWGVAWRVTAVVALILFAATWFFHAQMPELSALLDGRQRGSVTLLDHEGNVFAWRGETYGGQVSSTNVSKHLRNAVVATEDKRFFGHFGVSPRGIASAIRINLSEGRGAFQGNGGSTITQQVAKLLCLGVEYDPKRWKTEAEYEADCRKGSLVRKLKEVPYAFALEWKYSKDEILTIYLNRAYLGAGARGFEAAAQRYFGKSSRQVKPAEAAMLAGLLVAPSYYAPTNNLKRAQDRASVIIGLMQDQGYLTKAEADDARSHPATLSPEAEQRAGGYYADWVVDSAPSYLARDTTEDVTIHTTLDQHLQKAAESAVDAVFETKLKAGSKAQAAVVVMSADGAVRAMVGGRKIGAPGSFNRATMARRQTGSAFKPFVYAAALDMGYSPADYVDDSPLTIRVPGSGPWTPQNYTRDFKGVMTLTEALKESRNIPAVRISEAVGRDAVRQVAEQFGIVSDLAQGPALALGVSEATLVEMTGAFAGILNGGSSVKPYGLIELRLKGDKTPLITQSGGIGERVIQEDAARYLTWMMMQVIDSGTGARARLPGREAAGKTGTTQAARDAWFVGFTADYVAGVWMGYDDNTPLTGVTGGGLPAEIWKEVMVRVHEGLPSRPLPKKVPEPRLPPQVPGTSSEASSGGVPQPGQPQPGARQPDLAERIINEVLGTFLGGRW
ncbi:MAG: PBP1A family penicillin-binding protein [Rhodobacterales bacterium]|nr:PBP1A family penicillin-binding protein [Rhodobacterales bacterium]MDX5501165.1 PBP1A family penicillin-binding protein [Rhodobacterales bacterium]